MDLSHRISELLYHYDCVIVPELGGFVTEYRSARIDKLLHVIYPPGKDLRFNAQLKKNDGLLANAISQADSISHEEANSRIKSAVETYFSDLEDGKPVIFNKVGVLYLDSNKNIQFSPDTSVNYLLDSFRLKKVFAQPVLQASVNERSQLQEEEFEVPEETLVINIPEHSGEDEVEIPVIPIQAKENQGSNRKWLAAAALVPLLFYLGYVGVTSNVIQDGTIQLSDLNPFQKSTSSVYSERSDMSVIDFSENELPAIEHAEKAEVLLEEERSELNPEVKKLEAESSVSESNEAAAVNTYVAPRAIGMLEFHVIGGCFTEEANAEKLVGRLRKKGYEAFIIDKRKGLHRVAYGSFPSRDEALLLLQRVKEEEQIEAWLLRKK